MGKYLIDCGTFPAGVSGCRVTYTTATLQGYIKLADSNVPKFEVEIGEAIWEIVERARGLGVDPELALRRLAESRAPRPDGQE